MDEELLKSIILGVLGLVALVFSAITNAGLGPIVFEALLTATSLGFIVYDAIKKEKKTDK